MFFNHYKLFSGASVVFVIIVSSSGLLQCEKTIKHLDSIKLCKNPDKVKILNFNNNNISKLDEGMFLKYTSVTDLCLSHTNLSEISCNIFRGMDSLETLYLNDNQIIKLDNNSFGKIPTLMQLHLNNNNILDIDQGAFDQVPKLRNIYLKNNVLSTVGKRIFPAENVVYSIDFASNSLTDVTFISNLIHVAILDLPYNKIEALESKNFVNLINLQYIGLKHNLIKELPINLFVHQTNLIQVDLSHNRLMQIQTGTFNVGFRDLLLNDNEIATVGVLNNISEINLEGNLLRELPPPKNPVNLFIDNNPWTCDFIYMLADYSNINLSYTTADSEKNIQGVRCEDKIKSRTSIDTSTERAGNVMTGPWIIIVVTISSSILILSLVTIFVCIKKRKEKHSEQRYFRTCSSKKRLSSLDNWSASGVENGYLPPLCEEHIYQEIYDEN